MIIKGQDQTNPVVACTVPGDNYNIDSGRQKQWKSFQKGMFGKPLAR